jgi:oxygen-independent coproporphyrinogen-3 oxidase
VIRGAPPPRALYLHYPFCAHRCHYCDFSVKRTPTPPVAEWLESVATELAWWFSTAGWTPPVPIDSLFVGGGTPSLLGADDPVILADTLRRWFGIDDDVEWTVESNPASLSESVAAGWRAAGANRLSIGIQALDDGALRWLGRLHDRSTALRAFEVARDAGFANVSVDLIFGLPEAVGRDLEREVESVLAAGVEHVSSYGLTVEPGTPLGRWVDVGRVTPAPARRYAAEYRRLCTAFSDAGMLQYEVSNFARDGRESRHNWYYWNRSSYLGLGPSAHGFFPPYRIWNEFRWDRYRSAIGSGAGPMAGYEELTAADEALERLWLGLRTREGLRRDEPVWSRSLEKRLAVWEAEGWIDVSGDRVVATVEGWLRLDELVAEVGRDLTPGANEDDGTTADA